MSRHREPVLPRFLAKIARQEGGCWLWTAARDKDGYGRFYPHGKGMCAHRFAYEYWVGQIPDGLQIDHLCDNPGCVNPAHLEPVTCEVNLKRGATTQARINSEKTHCPHGHPYDAENTRTTVGGLRYCLTCKREKKRAYDARRRELSQGGVA